MNQGKGIYFHPETMALSRVEDTFFDLGRGWVRISDDLSLGLLDARRLAQERGLAEDTTTIDWLEMTVVSWEQQRQASRLMREFQRDSERSREVAEEKPGLITRLMTGLGALIGPGHLNSR